MANVSRVWFRLTEEGNGMGRLDVFLGMRAAIEKVTAAGGGSIINISSIDLGCPADFSSDCHRFEAPAFRFVGVYELS